MREQQIPIVYVVPPNDSLKCPLHCGVYEDPVDTPCGCTFCRSCILDVLTTTLECPVHGAPVVPEHLRENRQVQDHLNELLIHCKGGLQQTVSGEWVTNPTGCKLWLNLGRRKEHENKCPYVKEEYGESEPTTIRTCNYRGYGCLFVGSTEQDTVVHEGVCGYGTLLRQLEQLQNQLTQKDQEIERLNNMLAQKKSGVSLPTVPNVNEVLDSISRGLEKLDQDSTKLFEEAKETLKKTRSAAYQTSLQVLHSIKEVVESARSEFIAKLEELEFLAKHKVRRLTNGSAKKSNNNTENNNTNINNNDNNNTENNNNNNNINNNNTEINNNNNNNESNNSTTSTSTTTDSIVESTSEQKVEESSTTSVIEEEVNSNPSQPNTIVEETHTNETEGDDDLKEFLEASKQEYLRDQAARMAEEESIKQAVRLSLLDLANNTK